MNVNLSRVLGGVVLAMSANAAFAIDCSSPAHGPYGEVCFKHDGQIITATAKNFTASHMTFKAQLVIWRLDNASGVGNIVRAAQSSTFTRGHWPSIMYAPQGGGSVVVVAPHGYVYKACLVNADNGAWVVCASPVGIK